jgi:hypothetical protein
MSDLVKALIDRHGCDPDEVATGIGAQRQEVDLLYQGSIFKARKLQDYPFSKAWVPGEDGKRAGAEAVDVERDDDGPGA